MPAPNPSSCLPAHRHRLAHRDHRHRPAHPANHPVSLRDHRPAHRDHHPVSLLIDIVLPIETIDIVLPILLLSDTIVLNIDTIFLPILPIDAIVLPTLLIDTIVRSQPPAREQHPPAHHPRPRQLPLPGTRPQGQTHGAFTQGTESDIS
ncbi:hypothetical protein A4X13_0g8082 [Tilletia indica]|uniref:Uncharacterized protein n=1 Tax=Tilletia indica TaxID=43049 RepID=A0A8T8SGD3_9BASI|nr:hypothetical protein A4X13_0g8082 [Tilletia indica]